MPIDTKKIISQKFTELIRQKGLDKVTVSELVESCGISRQAFYYHFQDILDVIQYGMVIKIDLISEACREAETIEEAITVYVRFFTEDRREINRLLDSRLRVPYIEMLTGSIRSYLEFLMEKLSSDKQLSNEERDFALNFYSCGICQMLLKKPNCTPSEISLFAETIKGELGLF